METIEKMYKDGYLEKCELKEDEYGFYLDLHFVGIDGEGKELYIPKVRLGFTRNVVPVIIQEPNEHRSWNAYNYKVELGPGHCYVIENTNGKVVTKTGEIIPFRNEKYVEVVPEKDMYTLAEIARAFDMISAVSLKELLSKAKKQKEAVKTEERKNCLTCKWHFQTPPPLHPCASPCRTCTPSYSNWEEKD